MAADQDRSRSTHGDAAGGQFRSPPHLWGGGGEAAGGARTGLGELLDRGYGLRGDASPMTEHTEAFGRFPLHVHSGHTNLLGKIALHLRQVRLQARLLGDDSAVDVDDAVAHVTDRLDRDGEHLEAGRPRIFGLAGREKASDVTESCGAEQRIDDRVREDVRIRIPVKPGRVRNEHPTEHERTARLERMDVVSDSDPHRVAVSCSRISASTTSRSSGVVSLMFAGSPGTTVTTCPVAATSCASSSPTSPASAASRCARASRSWEKPCGVCARTTRERSSDSTRRLPSTRLTASRGVIAGNAAPDSIAAARTRRTSAAVASGRAASWTRTKSQSPSAASPRRTDSWRLSPPGLTTTDLRGWRAWTSCSAVS